ncbi:MAG: lysostaphin resistance A-like protein [Halobacteriaceae archaeon]
MENPLPTRDRGDLAVIAVAVGVGSYLLVVVWGLVLTGLLGRPSGLVETQALNSAALLLATLLVVRLFFGWADLDYRFLDLSRPGLSDLLWGGLGFLALVGVSVAVSILNIPTASHGLAEQARAAGIQVLWLLVPVSLLVVGPAEELVYRNLVQKTLSIGFGAGPAIFAASLVFALAHLPAYAGSGGTALMGSLGAVFLLSLVLGGVYAKTRSLLTVALLHGLYDVVAYANIFIDLGWP